MHTLHQKHLTGPPYRLSRRCGVFPLSYTPSGYARTHIGYPMTDDRIGHLVSEDLLAALNRVFPQTLPGINDTERRIFITVGHREVIDFLTRQHDEAASQSLEA